MLPLTAVPLMASGSGRWTYACGQREARLNAERMNDRERIVTDHSSKTQRLYQRAYWEVEGRPSARFIGIVEQDLPAVWILPWGKDGYRNAGSGSRDLPLVKERIGSSETGQKKQSRDREDVHS